MSGFQITCANRSTSGTIVRVGGQGWSLGVHEAIVKIMTGQLRLNILVGNKSFDVGVRGEANNAYLALEPDGQALHDFAELPSC
jgi:hypothetical protein